MKKTVIAVLVCVLVLAAVLFALTGPQSEFSHNVRFSRALAAKNYQAAAAAMREYGKLTQNMNDKLNEHIDEFISLCFSENYSPDETPKQYLGLEIFSAQAEIPFFDKMNETVAAFYDGTLDKQTAKTYLSRLGQFDFSSDKLKECVLAVNGKEKSDEAYASGTALYASGKFVEAAAELKKVLSEDKIKYSSAREYIEKCASGYCEPIIISACEYIDSGKTQKARELLEGALKKFEYAPARELLNSLEG